MPIKLQPAAPAALVCAVLAAKEKDLRQAQEQLTRPFGPVRARGPVYAFAYSQYYEKEMGTGLFKQILCFERPVDPADLPRAKHETIALEKKTARQESGRLYRSVNIDPGLLTAESLVLATTKHTAHRIAIAPGLYAELTLLYRKGAYRPFDWTYLDYQSAEMQEFLQSLRPWLLTLRANH